MRLMMTLLALFGLSAQVLAGPPAQKVLVGLADTDGLAGTRFESTVWMVNPSRIGVRVALGLVPAIGLQAPAPASRWLGPGQTLRLDNALADLWGGRFKFGALTLDAPAPIDAIAVTANVAGAQGAYGLTTQAVPDRHSCARDRPRSSPGSIRIRAPEQTWESSCSTKRMSSASGFIPRPVRSSARRP